ncbi:MAG: YceI family protein [Ignavibacteriae bacterium]|nr:YceI family protein [Ignavibacteriota bacterium]
MKFKKIAAIALCAAFFAPQITFSGTPLKIGTQGKKNSTLNNKVGENLIKFLCAAPLEEIKGSSSGVTGSFVLDLDNLEATTGQITVEVKTMTTGLNRRDSHLWGSDWLDGDKYHSITFDIKGLSDIQIIKQDNGMGEIKANAFGTFTMHGQAKQIKSPITLKFVRESEATKKRAEGDFALVQANFKIALKDFNVTGTKGLVGSKVGETIDIDANLYGSTVK